MSDLISRKDALDAIQKRADEIDSVYSAFWEGLKIAQNIVEKVPSAEPEPEEFEWCHDCKEYDQEKHCCHRWTKVIRQTVEEMKTNWRWTPVTEALPEKKEMVLITNNKGHVRCGQYQGTFDDKNYRWWWRGNTLEEVLAWMPLPEPWRD